MCQLNSKNGLSWQNFRISLGRRPKPGILANIQNKTKERLQLKILLVFTTKTGGGGVRPTTK